VKLTKNRLVFLLFWSLSLFLSSVFGQTTFLPPQKIKNAQQTHLWLSSFADLLYLEKNLTRFEHIEAVKVDGTVDIAKAAFLCSKLNVLQEVQLHRFQGILENSDLQFLEWVPQLSIYIPKNRVDATVLNDAWSLLTKVSLRFEEVPDNFEFLVGWKQLRSLSVLGDFGKEEADALLSVVGEHLPKLKHLELSLLGVSELPPKIKKCTHLHSLRIIDGSDWAQGKYVEDLGEWIFPLRVGSKKVKVGKGRTALEVERNVYMPLKWISSRPFLNSKEKAHLKTLFPDVQESEALTWMEDTEEEMDFAESEALLPYAHTPTHDKNTLLADFAEGVHAFIADTESDHVFLGDASWALMIPKQALQGPDTKPYHGKYQVTVKFLNSAEQLVAAGIHLGYDSVRQNYQLYPSFGIQVTVTSVDRQTELMMKPNYRAEVYFVSSLHENDRFYAWNNQSKKWMHYYDYDYQFDDIEKPARIDFYQFYKGQKTATIHAANSSWTLDEAFETEGYNYVMPPGVFQMRLGKFKDHYVLDPPQNAKEIRRITRGNNQVGIRLFPRNRKTAPGVQEFLLFDRTHSLFTELDAFEGFRLAFKTQNSFEQVAAFFKDRNWIDVRMKKMSDKYVLELRSYRQIWSIELLKPRDYVSLVSENDKSKWDLQMSRRFEQYNAKREAKKTLWAKLSKNQEQKNLEWQQNEVLTGLSASQKQGRMVIKSFGTFCMAHPQLLESNNIDLILCELDRKSVV